MERKRFRYKYFQDYFQPAEMQGKKLIIGYIQIEMDPFCIFFLVKIKQPLVETLVFPGKTGRTRIANRSLIPRCVQRQHTAAWRPARVNLVARQQFTDEWGGGLHCCPHPWQSLVIITSRLNLPGLELLILFSWASTVSALVWTVISVVGGLSAQRNQQLCRLNSVFSDSKTRDYCQSELLCFLLPVLLKFPKKQEGPWRV